METSAKVYSTAMWTVKPGREREFAAAWQRLADWTIDNQPGATKFTIFQDLGNDHLYIDSVPWPDTASIKAWRETAQVAEFMMTARETCDDIKVLTMRPVATARRQQMAA